MTGQLAGLRCPGCERAPRFVLSGGTQAFCYALDCHVVIWDPTKTLAENVAGLAVIDPGAFMDDHEEDPPAPGETARRRG